MQPKLRQLVSVISIVLVMFVVSNNPNQASAATKRPVTAVASVKNVKPVVKTIVPVIKKIDEVKNYTRPVHAVAPQITTPSIIERPTVTVEAVPNKSVASEVIASRYEPVIDKPTPAEVVFKRNQINGNSALTVSYTITGTATPDDYIGLTNHSVYFPANVYEVTVVITPVNDGFGDERNGESVIFTINPDQNVHAPHYLVGQQKRAKVMIVNSGFNSAVELTANYEKNITIASDQRVDLEFTGNLLNCYMTGGQFGTDALDGFRIPGPNSLLGTSLLTWSTQLFPTETASYSVHCTGYMGTPYVDTVTVTVGN